MGVDYHTHIGPFVACEVGMVPATEPQRQCLKCGESGTSIWHHSVRFCPKCGGEVGTVDVPCEREAVDAHDVADEIGEALAHVHEGLDSATRPDGLHLWVANRYRDVPEYGFDPEEGPAFEDLTGLMIVGEIAAFSAAYAPELGVLRGRYGAKDVRVRWGIIHTIS